MTGTAKSPPAPDAADESGGSLNGGVNAEQLRSLVERIERLEEGRAGLGSDIKDLFVVAKHAGFDVRALRQLVRLRKMDPDQVAEQEALLHLYQHALGMS
jgi:uncharacterized protein (UPF0335 family)